MDRGLSSLARGGMKARRPPAPTGGDGAQEGEDSTPIGRPCRALVCVHKRFETRMCTLVSRDAVQVVRIENGRVYGRHAGPFLWALRGAGERIRTLDVHLGNRGNEGERTFPAVTVPNHFIGLTLPGVT
jgi:hypothetical protein